MSRLLNCCHENLYPKQQVILNPYCSIDMRYHVTSTHVSPPQCFVVLSVPPFLVPTSFIDPAFPLSCPSCLLLVGVSRSFSFPQPPLVDKTPKIFVACPTCEEREQFWSISLHWRSVFKLLLHPSLREDTPSSIPFSGPMGEAKLFLYKYQILRNKH